MYNRHKHRFASNGFCSPPSPFLHDFRPAHVRQRCYSAEIHTPAPPLRSPFVSSLQPRSVHQRSLRSLLLLLVFYILERFFLFPTVVLWVSCHFELKCCILDREDEDRVFFCCVVVFIIFILGFFLFLFAVV
jgi:hypothetical protein